MVLRFFILFLFLPIITHGQLKIEGNVLDKIKKTPLPDSRVTIYLYQLDTLVIADSTDYHPYREVRKDSIYKTISRAFSDSSGGFTFFDLTPGIYKIMAEGLFRKTKPGNSYEESEAIIYPLDGVSTNNPVTVLLSVYCPFDETKHLTACPQCKRSDSMKEIIEGLPLPPLNEERYIYTFNCSPPRCRPSKYCVRCKLEF